MQGNIVHWDGEGKTRKRTVDSKYLAALPIDPALDPRLVRPEVHHAGGLAVVCSGTHSRKQCRLIRQTGRNWTVHLDSCGEGAYTSIPRSSLLVKLPATPAGSAEATTQGQPQVGCLSFTLSLRHDHTMIMFACFAHLHAGQGSALSAVLKAWKSCPSFHFHPGSDCAVVFSRQALLTTRQLQEVRSGALTSCSG